ncbi:EamA family transporter [Kitasatospora sp. NPDC057542]|uniref:EamA family transporter n=1 Tax=Kitasatospora sp. NPDC057542 TaxID=3346162 RepID=UPI00369EF0FB
MALLLLGAVPTLFAHHGYFTGPSTVSGTTAAVLVRPEPATAAVIGVLFLGEPLTVGLPAGSALLVAAIAAPAREERGTAGPRRPPRRAPCGRPGPGGVLWWSA